MARMYKCDRCGKKFSGRDCDDSFNTPSEIRIGYIGEEPKSMCAYDICPKCSGEFYSWKHKKEN